MSIDAVAQLDREELRALLAEHEMRTVRTLDSAYEEVLRKLGERS